MFKIFAIEYIRLLFHNADWLYHPLFDFRWNFNICAFRKASDCRNLILGGFKDCIMESFNL